MWIARDKSGESAVAQEARKHESIAGELMVFNVCCKCGHRGTEVSEPGDYEVHVAEAVLAALEVPADV